MPDLEKTYLFRMSHIDNIDHIWQHGITKIDSVNANKKYKPIGDGTLISTRNGFVIPNGNTLGQYIPFYFWYRMPMLLMIQTGYKVQKVEAEDVVYLITSVAEIINHQLKFVFTDGHANTYRLSSFYEENEIMNVESLLDFKSIKDNYWIDEKDLDKKRKKEAEFLVESDIPKTSILGFVVYNQTAKDKLIRIGIPETMIHIRTSYYFQS